MNILKKFKIAKLQLILSLIAICITQNSNAEDKHIHKQDNQQLTKFIVKGHGASLCSKVSLDNSGFHAWALGYLTGLSVAEGNSKFVKILDILSTDTILKEVDSYCADRPSIKYVEAVTYVYNDIGGRKLILKNK